MKHSFGEVPDRRVPVIPVVMKAITRTAWYAVLILILAGCATPLHKAAQKGDTQAATALLDNGVDVNEQDAATNTALFWAIAHSHVDMVRLLLERGAIVRSGNGRDSYLHWAKDPQIIQMLKDAQSGETSIIARKKVPQKYGTMPVKKENKPTILVMDFLSTEVPQDFVKKTSELLRIGLMKTGKIIVLMRSQSVNELKRKGLRFEECADVTGAGKAGMALAADKAVVGSLMTLGKKIIINCVLVDVPTGKGDRSFSQTCDSEDKIDEAVSKLSTKILKSIDIKSIIKKKQSS